MTDKQLVPDDFIFGGYLQEVNRLFFHPLGLALTVHMDCHGQPETTVFTGLSIQDWRHDPEGFAFDESVTSLPNFRENAEKIEQEISAALARRQKALGYGIQIVPNMADKSAGTLTQREATAEDLDDSEEAREQRALDCLPGDVYGARRLIINAVERRLESDLPPTMLVDCIASYPLWDAFVEARKEFTSREDRIVAIAIPWSQWDMIIADPRFVEWFDPATKRSEIRAGYIGKLLNVPVFIVGRFGHSGELPVKLPEASANTGFALGKTAGVALIRYPTSGGVCTDGRSTSARRHKLHPVTEPALNNDVGPIVDEIGDSDEDT